MTRPAPFHLPHFLPYLLNQAAEAASQGFQEYYRTRYGMLRTEWRVLFHLGCYGTLSAKEICEKAAIHKTKVSRAVAALENKRLLTRGALAEDRRVEQLDLTAKGQAVFEDLSAAAERFEAELVDGLAPDDLDRLRDNLLHLANLRTGPR
ncbi:MarR family winged helix-turn-helix transcriptional regulator [Hasllibacter sp. MH4015]|uniref:MarR family winged helix-turn-helix transcriptional regulator n=1 Tax=Hasllibacter sp. MH4015 TaxID=2854029 RepID=UPI001CD2741A|nr:MarR family transcriptional regulator [Hasllibacter sp. MH4015]